MSDLMKCLYDFVCDRRMGSIYADPEYAEVFQSIGQQSEKVKKDLDEAQWKEVNRLLDSKNTLFCIENEHLFRATLGLARELAGTGV